MPPRRHGQGRRTLPVRNTPKIIETSAPVAMELRLAAVSLIALRTCRSAGPSMQIELRASSQRMDLYSFWFAVSRSKCMLTGKETSN